MGTEEKDIVEVTDNQLEQALPKPCGYKLLIAMPEAAKEFDGGILKPDAMVKQDEVASSIGVVLDMGPEAYTDKTRYPNGPWCKVGDYVIMRAYTGTRFRVYGKEFRLINEDTVEGVVSDPKGYSRI